MKNKFQKTIYACFTGYVVLAIINNFIPLLFLTFQRTYEIPLREITMLVTINFGVQLLTDFLSAYFVDQIGYRISIVAAHLFCVLGLLGLTILPECMPTAFSGLLVAVIIYAIGGGLIEVLISPIMESCPTEHKEKAMSLLHSFFCWGHVAVVLLSTIFFRVVGIDNWKIMAAVWAIIPLVNAVIFMKAPIASLIGEEETGMKIGELLRNKIFWLLLIMMVAAGASEQAVSQWASTFAEKGLGVSKTMGDLMGPLAFAALMGIARTFYGKYGHRIQLDKFMIGSSFLCVISYLLISLSPLPVLSLIACGICGFSVGIMWPGTFSKAAASLRNGGTVMFALLALGGDIGCGSGPTLVGMISGAFGDNLKLGILAAIVFPIVLVCCLLISLHSRERRSA